MGVTAIITILVLARVDNPNTTLSTLGISVNFSPGCKL